MGKRKTNGKNAAGKKKKAAQGQANRCYKDTVFRMLFREKVRLLELYNAVSGKDYTDPKELEVVTLENAVYMGMKNDLAFLIDLNLHLYEHQSTDNKNMPLRFLQYVAAEYSKLTAEDNLYGETPVRIPAPHFVVFYNGTAKCPENKELRLSDAFLTAEKEPQLELRVLVLNINGGFNKELKAKCRTLGEYMQYVDMVRANAKEMPLKEAVDKAVDACIRQDILKDFLLQNKAEVKHMSIFEYDEETARRVIRREGYEIGMAEGKVAGELYSIVSLVCRKLKKNKTLEEIAGDLEEEISVIEPIYHAAEKFAPEYAPDRVFERINADA